MINNINELKKEYSNLSNDELDELLKWATPFFEFNEYMKKEYGKSDSDIETESAKFSKDVLPQYLEEMEELSINNESSLKFIVGLSGKIYKQYAESYDYPESDKIEESLTKYMELILKHQMNQNGKK